MKQKFETLLMLMILLMVSTHIAFSQSIQNNYLKAGKNGGYAYAEYIGDVEKFHKPFEETVQVHPNPATENMIVEWRLTTGTVQLEIISYTGTVLRSIFLNSKMYMYEINISELPAGVYVLQITSADNTTVHKSFVKQ